MKKIIGVILFVISWTCLSYAQISTREIIDRVVSGPELAVLDATNESTLFEGMSKNVLSGPEVEFEHLWGGNGLTKWSLGVTQNIEWPGIYRLHNRQLAQQASTNALAREALRTELCVQAAELLVKIKSSQSKINEIDKILTIFKRLSQSMDTALQFRAVTLLDKKKTDIEIAKYKIDRNKIEAEKKGYINRLYELSGGTVEIDDETASNIFPYWGRLEPVDYYMGEIDNAPGLLVYESMMKDAALKAEEARMSALPGFGLGYRHEKEVEGHFNGFAISLNLPTWNSKKSQKAAEWAISSGRVQAQTSRKVYELRVLADYETARRLYDEITEIRTSGLDVYLNLLDETFKGGEISVIDYLREYSYYIDSILNLLDLEEEYEIALVSLNRNKL